MDIEELTDTFSLTDVILFASSAAFGAYRGYCHSKGIHFNDGAEFALIFGPTIMYGALGAAMGAAVGSVKTEPVESGPFERPRGRQ